MAPPPDTINQAYELMRAAFIETLTQNAADALIDGHVRASNLMGIGLNFRLIASRAVSATRDYRETLERFGGSDVTIIGNDGIARRVFKPWLDDAIKADKEQIGAIIDNAIREGKPLREVEQALDEVFAMREHNARLTAYQETKALFNKGTMQRFEEERVQKGIWHHSDPQENPRPEHQDREGKEYELSDPVWNELEFYFCHCWCEPVIVHGEPLGIEG